MSTMVYLMWNAKNKLPSQGTEVKQKDFQDNHINSSSGDNIKN